MTIYEMQKAAFWNSRDKGFWELNPLDSTVQLAKLALVTSEIGEAVEAIRDQDYANLEEELADIVIRTGDLAHALGFELESAVEDKIRKTAARPKGHGRKVAI